MNHLALEPPDIDTDYVVGMAHQSTLIGERQFAQLVLGPDMGDLIDENPRFGPLLHGYALREHRRAAQNGSQRSGAGPVNISTRVARFGGTTSRPRFLPLTAPDNKGIAREFHFAL